MTNTTAPQIDLSTLQQGDTVVFRDGQNAIVNHVIDLQKSDKVRIFAFMIYKGTPINRDMYYLKDGCPVDNLDSMIIQIIKNPKRWTDDDMKAAFNGAILQIHKQNYADFELWFEQYKESKK